MLEIRNLRKEYNNVTPLKDVSLTVNDGDVIAIIGPSGTGKSTLIRCVNMLEKPTKGQILLNGEDITQKGYDIKTARQRIGMVFQSFNLFGHLTVIENLMIAPCDLLKKSRQEAYDTGIELLSRVGLKEKANSYPDELSGGQKQRVAIARTLCMDPEVILFDEPTSALDPTMVSEVQAVIRDLSASEKTMMIVTHEMNFARAISNRVLFMDEGGIYEEGTPEEIFERPKREKTRRFVRRLKVFESIIDSSKFDFYSFNASLDRYLMQNDVPPSEKYRIRLAIEEIVQQLLWPNLSDPKINITVEYSEADKISIVAVSYGGGRFDIRDSDNDIALSVLTKVAGDLDYHYSEEEGKNTATVKIREE